MKKLFVDQYGNWFYASTIKELRSKIGGGGLRVSPIYLNRKNGDVVRIGYVIGQHWFTEYIPNERIVNRRSAP